MKASRVLIVDDEAALLQLMQRYVTRLGYEVDACSRPHDAWRLFEARPDCYLLVLADLTMPEMSGEELLSRMMGLNPELRVLVCSGYPFHPDKLPGCSERKVGFLQKPFVPKMLAQAMENLLGAQPAP